MANIRKFQMRRLSIKGGSEQPISIQSTYINVLRFINWGAAELRVSGASDPQLYPQVIVNGNGGTNNLMDPAGIERIFVYAAADITFGLIEMQVEDPMLILAMESVVSNLMTALPAGTNHIGDVGVDVAGVDVSDAAPFPVKPGAGITFDVSDRAARAMGKAGLQVAGADVSDTNRVPTTGRSLTPKTAVRAALAAGATATVWTPALGFSIRLATYHVTTSAATVLTVKLGGQVIWERDFATAGGADVTIPQGGILGAADGALIVTTSAAATVGAYATGTEE